MSLIDGKPEMFDPISDAERRLIQAAYERCAKVAESFSGAAFDTIGPLFGAGWEAAVKHIADKIRE